MGYALLNPVRNSSHQQAEGLLAGGKLKYIAAPKHLFGKYQSWI